MKKAFFSISILALISCNSKTGEKVQEGEISTIQNEEIIFDTLIAEIVPDTIVEEIVTEEPDAEEKLELILEFIKTPCFGKCPTYSVQLWSNGKMIYDGKSNVEKMGRFESSANNSFIYTIFQEAEKIDFFELSDKYPTDGTTIPDLPKTIIFLKNGTNEHRIIDAFYSPLPLQGFEQFLVEKFDSQYWTKPEQED
jgi:Domain of unknown function (DUF6438)